MSETNGLIDCDNKRYGLPISDYGGWFVLLPFSVKMEPISISHGEMFKSVVYGISIADTLSHYLPDSIFLVSHFRPSGQVILLL